MSNLLVFTTNRIYNSYIYNRLLINELHAIVMKKMYYFLMLFTVVMALAGCSTLQTASDFNRKTDFSIYKTFDFYDKGIARLKLNDLDKRRMLDAIEDELIAKGFTKSKKPDMLVNLVVVSTQVTDVYDYGPRWGWRWGYFDPWGMNRSIDRYREGTIIIDFLDPKQKTIVWHGRGTGFNLDNYNKREERVQKGVAEILAQYPPKK
jgi:hypothetical protein